MLANHLEPLMASYASSIGHQKTSGRRMADSVAEVARKVNILLVHLRL